MHVRWRVKKTHVLPNEMFLRDTRSAATRAEVRSTFLLELITTWYIRRGEQQAREKARELKCSTTNNIYCFYL